MEQGRSGHHTAPQYSMMGSTKALNIFSLSQISLILPTLKHEIIDQAALLAAAAREAIATDTPFVSCITTLKLANPLYWKPMVIPAPAGLLHWRSRVPEHNCLCLGDIHLHPLGHTKFMQQIQLPLQGRWIMGKQDHVICI